MIGRPDKPLQRYYVTMTWEQWPEDGSYGTVVEARSYDEAAQICLEQMAEQRSKESGFDPEQWKAEADGYEPLSPEEMDDSPEWYMANYSGSWHLVDCFLVDDFIERHSKKEVTQ